MENVLQGIVTQGKKRFVFDFQPLLSNSENDLVMEKIEFYQKWAKMAQMPHLEFEILSLPKDASTLHLHIHRVGYKKLMCWTKRIADYNQALWILQTWCLGSVYTILTGIPFDTYLQSEKVHSDSDKFANDLSKDFGLTFELTTIDKRVVKRTPTQIAEIVSKAVSEISENIIITDKIIADTCNKYDINRSHIMTVVGFITEEGKEEKKKRVRKICKVKHLNLIDTFDSILSKKTLSVFQGVFFVILLFSFFLFFFDSKYLYLTVILHQILFIPYCCPYEISLIFAQKIHLSSGDTWRYS